MVVWISGGEAHRYGMSTALCLAGSQPQRLEGPSFTPHLAVLPALWLFALHLTCPGKVTSLWIITACVLALDQTLAAWSHFLTSDYRV